MSKEVLLGWDGSLQPEECVVLHTGLPQVLTGPVVDHVEAQQCFPAFVLVKENGLVVKNGKKSTSQTRDTRQRTGIKSKSNSTRRAGG